MLPLLALIALLIFLSGLVSMCEAAIFTVPLAQVQLAVERKKKGARRLLAIKKHLQRPIGTLVILNNVVNIGGSLFVGHLAEGVFGRSWLGLFSAVFTFSFIVTAEIIPKTIGERYAASLALASAPFLSFVTGLLLPLIWLIERLTLPFAREGDAHLVSEEEIRTLANMGNKAGSISRHETEIIRNAFLLNDVTARDIMTHRLRLSFLPAEKSLTELKLEEITKLHSRILIAVEGDLDRIDGVVYQRDLLLALARNQKDLRMADLKHPIQFVYDATPGHRLLREFQRTHQHLFVVVDEYGGTSGVVSLEDVLEELVGDIEDEMDAREKAENRSPSKSASVSPGGGPASL
jgi:CBS domain containing-hemolysin-like protein